MILRKLFAPAFLSAAVAASAPAHAAPVTYIDTYLGSSETTGGLTRAFPNDETGTRPSPFTGTFRFTALNPRVLPSFTVAGFDTSLGTLTGVTIDYLRTGDRSLRSERFVRALCVDELGDFCGTAGSNAEIGVAYGFYNQTLDDVVTTAFNYARETPNPFGYVFTPTNITASITYSDPADLSAFTAGDLLFRPVAGVDVENVLSCQSSTGTISFCRVSADVRITQRFEINVSYTYEPAAVVPLPAGLPLLFSALGLLAVARHRRAQAKSL